MNRSKLRLAAPDISFSTQFERLGQIPQDAELFNEWVFPDGELWASFYRVGHDYLLRFPGLADFIVTADGLHVSAFPMPGVSEHTVEHLYLNQVFPLALNRQGRLVLHASAVEIGDFAIAFVGESGRGKSTLAASFSTSGCRFLTDDGLQFEKEGELFVIRPSHPSIRLWDDSRQALIPDTAKAAPALDYTTKSRLLAGEEIAYCDAPRPIRAFYFLGEGKADSVLIEPINARDAMIKLVRHSFLLDLDEKEMLSRHFEQLASLVNQTFSFGLDYPRSYDWLPMVCNAVIRHATGCRKPPA